MRIFSYARYLSKVTSSFDEDENKANSYIVYIVSPLYPVKSTISILRAQLVYITVIAALLALTLALYLASRISKPIKGNYKFCGRDGKRALRGQVQGRSLFGDY